MIRYYAVMFFQIALVLIYLGIGVYVLMTPIPAIDQKFTWGRAVFGVAAIAYGIFRFWRAKRNADDDTEYDEED